MAADVITQRVTQVLSTRCPDLDSDLLDYLAERVVVLVLLRLLNDLRVQNASAFTIIILLHYHYPG